MTRHSWFSVYNKSPFALAARIGLDAGDSDEIALRKRLAVALCAGTLPLTVLWSAIYLAAGVPIAAAIPGFYSVFTPINTAIFARTRNVGIYRFTQLLLIPILPWLVTISLGGFKQSSVVIIWAALCPIGSLLLDDLRRTLFWIAGFVGLLIVTAVLSLISRLPNCRRRSLRGSACSMLVWLSRSPSGFSITLSAGEIFSSSRSKCCCSTSCPRRFRTG
jgi:guanylate cyclase